MLHPEAEQSSSLSLSVSATQTAARLAEGTGDVLLEGKGGTWGLHTYGLWQDDWHPQ